MSTVHDDRYNVLIEKLKQTRDAAGLSQGDLATKLGFVQSQVSKVETKERRLDIIELYDWLQAMGADPIVFLTDLGWSSDNAAPEAVVPRDNNAALPIRGRVEEVVGGVSMVLTWQGQTKKVLLSGISKPQYLAAEAHLVGLFTKLNRVNADMSNRQAIFEALNYAVTALPGLNPSDVYHHVVYRLYLREYNRTRPEQSWVRAGGEAMELFVQNHYVPMLAPHGIRIHALFSAAAKKAALEEMGLVGRVGNSKLDVALYGTHRGQEVIFGGVHCKASLAERVSDDVPCSQEMMKAGLSSYLYTFDAKSYPPPGGDLVNYGELGSPQQPSDKREYIERHGSFDACYSYNTRTAPSPTETRSGKRIYVCTMQPGADVFPEHVVAAWQAFKAKL